MRTSASAVSLVPLLLLSSIKGLQIDDVEGDKESWGEIDGRQELLKESDVYDIYDDLIDELVEGRAELAGIDVSEYLRDGINDDMETDKLTDLPENLQQLQQQLLQVRHHYRLKKTFTIKNDFAGLEKTCDISFHHRGGQLHRLALVCCEPSTKRLL